jgi:iron complex outermembrane receptor protein
VFKLPAGMLQYAAGYQFRKENLELSPSAALLTGDIAGLGGATRGYDADRRVNAVYGEVIVPVIKNLDLNLAARYDDYSDVGSTTNWKGNVRWQPSQQLLVRGSYGTGFRAPTLNNLFEPNVLQTSPTIQDPASGFSGQVNELTGGNPDLKPETSTQYGLGLVFQPLPSLAIGLDWFNIEIDDAISQPSTQEVISQEFAGNPLYAGKVVRDANGAIIQVINPPANTGKLKAQGMDLELRYRETLGPGVLALALNGTYYFKFDQSSPGAGTSQKVATMTDPTGTVPVISSTIGLDGLGVVPRYKQYLSATWVQGDWATTIGNQFTNGYYAGANWAVALGDPDAPVKPVRMPSQTLWDLQVAYAGFKNLILTVGARNLFDKQPANFSNAFLSQFQSGYDSSQYDPRGRFVYLTGNYTF